MNWQDEAAKIALAGEIRATQRIVKGMFGVELMAETALGLIESGAMAEMASEAEAQERAMEGE